MDFLFLRGKVPTDRDYREIIFDRIDQCDDVWTQIAFRLSQICGAGEIWYWGKDRVKEWHPSFREVWMNSFANVSFSTYPKFIFCRGGFPEYMPILNRCKGKSKLIYYGAGKRFCPKHDIYDFVFVDSPRQKKIVESKVSCPVFLFLKPCAENIFPLDCSIEKKYDVCYCVNFSPAIAESKGLSFVIKNFPKDLSLLHLGMLSNKKILSSNMTSKRVLRNEMWKQYQSCKVGIVVSDSKIDSCPRVIPEFLYNNIPLVLLDETHCWSNKYITEESGILSNRKDFWKNVRYAVENFESFAPRNVYAKNCNLDDCCNHILESIDYSTFRGITKFI